jgi:hypothetical protein
MRLLLLNEAAAPANQCSKSESLEHDTVVSLQYDSVARVPVASIWILFILSHLKLGDVIVYFVMYLYCVSLPLTFVGSVDNKAAW